MSTTANSPIEATASPLAQAAAAALEQRAGKRRHRLANSTLIGGLAILGLVFLFVVIFPIVSPYAPNAPDFAAGTFLSPTWAHPLGTDNFGRDNLTRIAYGGRVDLMIAIVATSVTVIFGSTLGLLTGYFGGLLDTLIMRIVDFTVALPYLILVIAIVAIIGTGTFNIVYAIWLVGWISYARIIRGETLVARQLEYIDAARVIGLGQVRIMLRHILPNVISAAIIFSMADAVLNILVSSSLSFLGLGVQPPNAEWGLMVSDARAFFLKDWALMTYPGLAILIVGAGFGLVGDGLAQALRPKG